MLIDPELMKVIDNLPLVHISEVSVAEARESYLRRATALPVLTELPSVVDRTVPGAVGGPDVPVRVFTPVESPHGLGVVAYFHGGGWTIGNLDTHDMVARRIAAHTGAIVVAVDYRLAPEHPFPAAVDDSYAVLRWLGEHATTLGGAPSRLAVAGDSAGANLAAAMTLLCKENGPALKFQLLWYPATVIDHSLPSVTENADAPILTTTDMDVFFRYYLGDLDPADAPPTLTPGTAADHTGLPPAFISTADHDPLRDDGLQYAETLRAAGVPVTARNYPDLVHGYVAFAPAAPAAAAAVDEALAAMKAAL